MKIVNQSAILLEPEIADNSSSSLYGFIETVARTCYKSESRGNPTAFVKGLEKAKHRAMLEHAYVFFRLDEISMRNFLVQLDINHYKYLNIADNFVSGSFRTFLDLGDIYASLADEFNNFVLLEMLKQLGKVYPDIFEYNLDSYDFRPSAGEVELISQRELINNIYSMDMALGDTIISSLVPITIKFITNRGVSHELTRHRPCSFAQESQRYIDYDKDKFGSEITVIKPFIEEGSKDWEEWKYAMEWCETVYKNLRGRGVTPQIARGVLPNDCKTEIIMTAVETEWQHIINLRYHGTTGAPHPQMKELMGMAYPLLSQKSEGRIK